MGKSKNRATGPSPAATPVEDLARQILHARIDNVILYLKKSAKPRSPHCESIHHLRTGSRRAIAALELFYALLPQQKTRKLYKLLKKVRKSAGNARDYDVIINKYQSTAKYNLFVKFIENKRAHAQIEIRALYHHLKKGKTIARKMKQVSAGIKPGTDCYPMDFSVWGKSKLSQCMADVFSEIPENTSDLDQLHQFRIKCKNLRYVMELTMNAFPTPLENIIYPQILDLTSILGDINDCKVLIERIAGWQIQTINGHHLMLLDDICKNEQQTLDNLLNEYQQQWTTTRLNQLYKNYLSLL